MSSGSSLDASESADNRRRKMEKNGKAKPRKATQKIKTKQKKILHPMAPGSPPPGPRKCPPSGIGRWLRIQKQNKTQGA